MKRKRNKGFPTILSTKFRSLNRIVFLCKIISFFQPIRLV